MKPHPGVKSKPNHRQPEWGEGASIYQRGGEGHTESTSWIKAELVKKVLETVGDNSGQSVKWGAAPEEWCIVVLRSICFSLGVSASPGDHAPIFFLPVEFPVCRGSCHKSTHTHTHFHCHSAATPETSHCEYVKCHPWLLSRVLGRLRWGLSDWGLNFMIAPQLSKQFLSISY